MRTALATLALSALFAAPAAAQTVDTTPTIAADGVGTATLTPDLATFGAGVERVAKTSGAARNAANRRMAAVLRAVRGAGWRRTTSARRGSRSGASASASAPLPRGAVDRGHRARRLQARPAARRGRLGRRRSWASRTTGSRTVGRPDAGDACGDGRRAPSRRRRRRRGRPADHGRAHGRARPGSDTAEFLSRSASGDSAAARWPRSAAPTRSRRHAAVHGARAGALHGGAGRVARPRVARKALLQPFLATPARSLRGDERAEVLEGRDEGHVPVLLGRDLEHRAYRLLDAGRRATSSMPSLDAVRYSPALSLSLRPSNSTLRRAREDKGVELVR